MTFKAAKCPSCGGALQVPDDRATVKCMYCGVDVMVREAIQLAAGRVKEFTTATPVKKTPRSTGCAGFSLGCGGLAFISAIFALVGQEGSAIAAGALFAIALVFLIAGYSGLGKTTQIVTALKGLCPYCESPIALEPNAPGANCPACNKRIVIRDMKFLSVDTPVSGLKSPDNEQ